MATQPDPAPDTIAPGSPHESPPLPYDPAPDSAPDEMPPLSPDYDQPDVSPGEVPPPPD